MTIYVAYDYELRPSYLEATSDYYIYYYHRPYIRIPPFTIGTLAALALYCFNNETPEESRMKRWMDVIYNSRLVRVIMYVVGTIFVLGMIFIFYPINNHPKDFSEFFNVMFLTFSRALFTVGITLILLPGLMGRCWAVRTFLSLDIFTPLARLTFGAYLVHPIFMQFDALNAVTGDYLTINGGIIRYICWLVVSFVVSMLFTLLVETPFMILEKEFLMGGGKKSKKKNDKKEVRHILSNFQS